MVISAGELDSLAQVNDHRAAAFAGSTHLAERAPVVPLPRGPRVLIAHEVRLFREALRVALSDRHGLEVLPSTVDVDGVVLAARQGRPRVVILDLTGRTADGLNALRSLRSEVPDAAVLVVTEETDDAALVAAMSLGASGHLTTSAAISDVAQAVSDTARGKVLAGRRLEARIRHLALSGQPAPPCTERLTDREREVLRRLAQGMNTRAIAADLGCAHNTVRTHIQNVLTKLGVHSRVAAATLAVRNDLV